MATNTKTEAHDLIIFGIGTVSCSRSLTDLGQLLLSCLVGIWGKIFCPKVYLACAPLFRIAYYSVIGDINKLLPELIDQAIH